MKSNTFQYNIIMKSSLKAYHGCRREIYARGLELWVHFQIGLGFRIISGFYPVICDLNGYLVVMLNCSMLLSILVQICSCTLHMSMPNTYPKP